MIKLTPVQVLQKDQEVFRVKYVIARVFSSLAAGNTTDTPSTLR